MVVKLDWYQDGKEKSFKGFDLSKLKVLWSGFLKQTSNLWGLF